MEENRKSIRSKAERGQSQYIKYLQVNPSLDTPKMYKNVNRHSGVSMVAGLRTSSYRSRWGDGLEHQEKIENALVEK